MKTITLYTVRFADMTGKPIGSTYHSTEESARAAEAFGKANGYRAGINTFTCEATAKGICRALNQLMPNAIEIR